MRNNNVVVFDQIQFYFVDLKSSNVCNIYNTRYFKIDLYINFDFIAKISKQ